MAATAHIGHDAPLGNQANTSGCKRREFDELDGRRLQKAGMAFKREKQQLRRAPRKAAENNKSAAQDADDRDQLGGERKAVPRSHPYCFRGGPRAKPSPERGRLPSVSVFILGRLGARFLQVTSVPSKLSRITVST